MGSWEGLPQGALPLSWSSSVQNVKAGDRGAVSVLDLMILQDFQCALPCGSSSSSYRNWAVEPGTSVRVKDDQQARGFSGIRGRTVPAAVDIWRIEDRCGIARIAERRTRGWIPPRANGYNPRKAPSSPGTSSYWMHSPCTQNTARDLRTR
jgi:hypothetical protein